MSRIEAGWAKSIHSSYLGGGGGRDLSLGLAARFSQQVEIPFTACDFTGFVSESWGSCGSADDSRVLQFQKTSPLKISLKKSEEMHCRVHGTILSVVVLGSRVQLQVDYPRVTKLSSKWWSYKRKPPKTWWSLRELRKSERQKYLNFSKAGTKLGK